MDDDGLISNGELFTILKLLVGDNLQDEQLQQIVDKTILIGDKDLDGKISFEEFTAVSKASFCTIFLLLQFCHRGSEIIRDGTRPVLRIGLSVGHTALLGTYPW